MILIQLGVQSICSAILFCTSIFNVVIIAKIEAANHYCIQMSTKAFSMNADSDQTETLLTSHGDLEAHVPRQSCSWEVSLSRMTEPLQLVLRLRRGRLWQEAANGTACPSELSVALQVSRFRRDWRDGSSLPKAPLIVPVHESSQQLIVRFSSGDLQPEPVCGRIELSIGIAKKGFCGRNMLLHRHRCLFVSDESLRLSDLNGTGAELAGISGVEQLRELQADNEKRRAEYPFIAPLDLRGDTRVGVFRCSDSNRMLHLNSGSDKCAAEPFGSSENLTIVENRVESPGAKCGSLQLPSNGRPILTFSDCNSPARFLLSFQETPRAETSSNCELDTSLLETSCQLTPYDSQLVNVWIFVLAVSLLLVFVAFCLFIFFRIRRSPSRQAAEQKRSSRFSEEQNVEYIPISPFSHA